METKGYREAALKHISSPDQADQLFRVTRPRAWLAFTALGVVVLCAVGWSLFGSIPVEMEATGILTREGGFWKVASLFPGQFTAVNVQVGDSVEAGQVVATLLTPNGGTAEVATSVSGVVQEVYVYEGIVAERGTSVLALEKEDANLEADIFVRAWDAKRIQPGMKAYILPSTMNAEEHGYMIGVVTYVQNYPATTKGLLALLENENLVQTILSKGPVTTVTILVTPDPNSPNGFDWTTGKGPDSRISTGTLCTSSIVLGTRRPISLLFPEMGN